MKLTKRQIQKIKSAHKKATELESKAKTAQGKLAAVIIELTGVEGFVDYLVGDGFGFTPESNNDTHIPVELLIELAEAGEDITEAKILDNLSI